MIVAPGTTSVSIDVQFLDDTGAALTGKVAADFPACKWSGGSNTADTTITLSDLAAITTAHPNDNTAGGVKEREGGWYRIDLPNTVVAAAGHKTITFAETTNKRIIAPVVDCQYTQVDVRQLLGTAWLTPGTAGTPDVNVKLISSDATAADNAEAFFDGTGYAGTNNVIPTVTLVNTLTTYTNNTPQTGDAFLRIGAAGASLTDLGGMSTAMKAQVEVEVVDGLQSRGVTSTRTGYLDNLSAGAVALESSVTAIQNNTRNSTTVPEVIERPDAGSTTYRIEIFLYDEIGNMEAPDSAPTIALVNQSGTDLSSRLDSVTMSLVSAGRYRALYTSSVGDTIEQLVWVFTVVEGGATRLIGRTSIIVDTTAVDFTATDRSNLGLILTATNTGVAPGAANGLFIAGSNAATTAASWTVTAANTHGSTVFGNTTMGTLTQTGAAAWGATQVASWYMPGNISVDGNTTLTGAVTASNTSNNISVGKLNGGPLHSGIATSAGAQTIKIPAGSESDPHVYIGNQILIYSGNGYGQLRTIASYNNLSFDYNLDRPWDVIPTTSMKFGIRPDNSPALGSSLDISLVNGFTTSGKAEIESEVNDALMAYDPPTNAEMVARTLLAADYATASNLATVASYLDTEIAAILLIANRLDTTLVLDGAVYQFTANALELGPGGGAAPTVGQIADAVFDELLSGHVIPGSAGVYLAAAGGAADPWLTFLPGAYPVGSAGYIIGNFVNLGTGAFTITITVRDNLLAPIEGAWVSLYRGGDERHGITDVNGVIVFFSNAVTWTSVAVVVPGFTFVTVPIVVTANTSTIYTGVSSAIILPPLGSSQVHVQGYTFNELGQAENGVEVHVKMVQPSTLAGVFDNKTATFTSVAGVVTLTNLFQGAWYEIWRGRSAPMRYYVPITADAVIEIDPIMGNDEEDVCL